MYLICFQFGEIMVEIKEKGGGVKLVLIFFIYFIYFQVRAHHDTAWNLQEG